MISSFFGIEMYERGKKKNTAEEEICMQLHRQNNENTYMYEKVINVFFRVPVFWFKSALRNTTMPQQQSNKK